MFPTLSVVRSPALLHRAEAKEMSTDIGRVECLVTHILRPGSSTLALSPHVFVMKAFVIGKAYQLQVIAVNADWARKQ